jgi:hypothetical protein
MSKRKNRKSPNLPQSAIERAKKQIEAPQDRAEAAEPEVEEVVEAAPPAPAPRPEPAVRREEAKPKRTAGSSPRRRDAQIQYTARKKNDLDQATIARILANPTKQVSEEELRETYHYVLSDLRGMAILAAGLIVALIVLAQVLPKI